MSDWQPIGTMPKDGQVVELLSPSEGIDTGYWYFFDDPDWAASNDWWKPFPGIDDVSGDFSTEKGSGDYTHWRPIN